MSAIAEVAADPDLEKKALAAGLLGVDAARRVGWAKFFEAFERVESLEEEVRQLRDERKHLRRAYSRLLGFIQASGPRTTPIWDEELSRHYAAERSFRHDDAWMGGWSLGEQHRFMVKGWDETQTTRYRASRSVSKAARREMLHELRAEGRRVGHTTKIRRRVRSDESIVVRIVCTCGDSFTETDEKAIYSWRYEHIAQAAFGRSFADHKELVLKTDRPSEP